MYDDNVELKREVERIQFETNNAFEKEKSMLRKKISDTENQLKKLELEKSLFAMDFEKQKTRWHIE